MTPDGSDAHATRVRLLAAYTTVYLAWGASYLAIKFAVSSMPALPMAGARNFLAGLVLVLVVGISQRAWGTRPQWRSAALVGASLMSSNAAVVFAITRIPSGVAALLSAMMPVWIVLLEWGRDPRHAPHGRTIAGLVLGVIGIALLIGPSRILGAGHIDLLGAGAILFGNVIWAAGSLYSRHAPRPSSSTQMAGMQLFCGGGLLFLVGLFLTRGTTFSMSQVSTQSWLAFAYLVVIASIAAFTAYVYLLKHVAPARATTYAFVNPVIAVILGALVGGEPLTPRVVTAAVVIVVAVALIVTAGSQPAAPPEEATA